MVVEVAAGNVERENVPISVLSEEPVASNDNLYRALPTASVCRHCPVSRSQSLTVFSYEPDASVPSGPNATELGGFSSGKVACASGIGRVCRAGLNRRDRSGKRPAKGGLEELCWRWIRSVKVVHRGEAL